MGWGEWGKAVGLGEQGAGGRRGERDDDAEGMG